MRSRTQLWTSAALLLVVATVPLVAQELPVATPEAVGMSSDRLDRLTAAIERYVEEGRLAGAVTTVLRDGKVVCTEAVGARDRESESPMTTDAIAASPEEVAIPEWHVQELERRLAAVDPEFVAWDEVRDRLRRSK